MKVEDRCKRLAKGRQKVSMIAVLQMLDLFEKKLMKAQFSRRKMVPWADAVAHSITKEQHPGTLFLKRKWKPTGLFKRLMEEKPVDKSSQVTEKSETMTGFKIDTDDEVIKLSSETNCETYSTKFLDEIESDEDIPNNDIGSEKKVKNMPKWVGNKLAHLNKSSKQTGKPTLKLSSNGTNQDIQEKEIVNIEMPTTVQIDEVKNRETNMLSGVKTGLAKVLMSLKLKRNPKNKNLDSINQKDSEQEKEYDHDDLSVIENTPADFPSIPRKRQKKQEASFSCPLCGRLFNENDINDHAFSCNGKQPRILRSNDSQLDESMDFVPIEVEEKPAFSAAVKIRGKTEANGKYTEWETACSKVDMGTKKSIAKNCIVNEQKEASVISLSTQMSKDFDKDCRRADLDNNGKNLEKEIEDKETQAKALKEPNVTRWISDDSDTENMDNSIHILDQYLKAGKLVERQTAKKPIIDYSKKGRKRAFIDYDDIDDSENTEKCYICGQTFQDGSLYNIHVTECVTRAEMKANFMIKENESSAKKDDKEIKDDTALQHRLGNRKSWAPYQKVPNKEYYSQSGNEDSDGQPSDNESPIKTFKPVSETSLFDFDNQFKNSVPKKKRPYLNLKKRRQKKRK